MPEAVGTAPAEQQDRGAGQRQRDHQPASRESTPSAVVGSTTGSGRTLRKEWVHRHQIVTSVLQQAGVVDRGRAAGPEDGHDDRQADDDLGGGHDHHEEGDDLAVEVAVLPGEGDEREVARR